MHVRANAVSSMPPDMGAQVSVARRSKTCSEPRDVVLRAERPVKGGLIEHHVPFLTLGDQRITERRLRVPGLHRGGLHERVRVFPGQAARYQLKQHRRGVEQAVGDVHVRPHPRRVHHQALHQADGQVQQVVGARSRRPAARSAPRSSVRCPARATAGCPR